MWWKFLYVLAFGSSAAVSFVRGDSYGGWICLIILAAVLAVDSWLNRARKLMAQEEREVLKSLNQPNKIHVEEDDLDEENVLKVIENHIRECETCQEHRDGSPEA